MTPTPDRESLRAELERLDEQIALEARHGVTFHKCRERRAEIRAKLAEIEAAGSEERGAPYHLGPACPDCGANCYASYDHARCPHCGWRSDCERPQVEAVSITVTPTPSPEAVAELVKAARELARIVEDGDYEYWRDAREAVEAAIRGVWRPGMRALLAEQEPTDD